MAGSSRAKAADTVAQEQRAVDLTSALAKFDKRATVRRCKMCDFLASLPPSAQEQLREALDDQERWSSTGIVRALSEIDFDIGLTTVKTHRSGSCPGVRSK